MAAAEDYHYWADRKEESIENDNGCISDDDESHKKGTEWSFIDQDGRQPFGREPKPILPVRGLVESQYAHPGLPRNQGADQLAGSEESDPEERICDSTVNMYVASNTDEEKGSQEGEGEISGEELSDLESINQQGDESSGCIAGSRGSLEEDCLAGVEALSGNTDPLLGIRVTSGRDQTGTKTPIRVPPRKCAGTGRKENNRSCFHSVNLV